MTLTHEEIESLRIAIAESVGWSADAEFIYGPFPAKKIKRNDIKVYGDFPDEKVVVADWWLGKSDDGTRCETPLPPYTTSLDAIQAAAVERFKEYKDRCSFDWHMANLSSINISYWQLTALDWCIAFARTAKIWKFKP
jgi:hypothetical protein